MTKQIQNKFNPSETGNHKTLSIMKEIIAQKQAKSASQKGLAGIDKTIGEKRKKIYVKKTGGLFDK